MSTQLGGQVVDHHAYCPSGLILRHKRVDQSRTRASGTGIIPQPNSSFIVPRPPAGSSHGPKARFTIGQTTHIAHFHFGLRRGSCEDRVESDRRFRAACRSGKRYCASNFSSVRRIPKARQTASMWQPLRSSELMPTRVLHRRGAELIALVHADFITAPARGRHQTVTVSKKDSDRP